MRLPSVALLLCLAALVCRAHIVGDEMAAAANKLLDSLSADQKAKAVFEWKNEERFNWHFIPKARQGLTLKDMSADQRKLALALVRSAMSDHGYRKTTNIMSLEMILRELEGPRGAMVRDPELYYFSIFGKPDPKGTWGWRVEGHHLSANFTIVKGEMFSSTPTFLGTNPAEVRQGPRKGLRVLAAEEDLARALLASFDETQRQSAVIDETAPKDILTFNKRKVTPLDPAGLPASRMTRAQKEQLRELVKTYIGNVRSEMAAIDLQRIEKAGWDKLVFAWAGPAEKGQGHYYRVQGPTFLLEYDNTQNNANHVHSVWRDFDHDFGEDLLRKHYEEVPHGNAK